MNYKWGNFLWEGYSKFLSRDFEKSLERFQTIQEKKVTSLLEENKETEFGRLWNFSNIKTSQEFSNSLPLQNYNGLKRYVDKIKLGQPNVLVKEPVFLLEPTSGTGLESKWIPYTKSLQSEFLAGIYPWISNIFKNYPRVKQGKGFWSVTPALSMEQSHFSQIKMGFQSDVEYLGKIGAKLASNSLIPSPDFKDNLNFEDYCQISLSHLKKFKELSWISIWNPSFFIQILSGLSQEKNPDEIIEKAKLHWPNLTLVSCWGDNWAATYLGKLKTLLPNCQFQPKGLLATEGIITIPYVYQNSLHHVIPPNAHYYEFYSESKSCTVPLKETNVGEEYQIIITTGGGLYRYNLGDRVKIMGYVKETPCLKFMGRAGCCDLTGEKFNEEQAESAISNVKSKIGFEPNFYFFTPMVNSENAGYKLFFSGDLGNQNKDALAEELDKVLSSNPYYKESRIKNQLRPVEVVQLSKEAATKYFIHKAKTQKAGDIKIKLIEEPKEWEKILT